MPGRWPDARGLRRSAGASVCKQWDNVRMNAPSQPVSPRRRLQELLAIPDSQRTEEQWDELNELEIRLAPGNRDPGTRIEDHGEGGGNPRQGQGQGQGQNRNPQGGGGPSGGGGGGGSQPSGRGPMGKRPARKFHKRPPKPPVA